MSVAAPPTRLNASEAAKRRTRLVGIVAKLQEATAIGGQHLSLEVRGKRFGWFLWDHHGDGRLAVHCRAPRGVGREMARSTSPAFHIPKYVGQHGWIGYWLDFPRVDWDEVRDILTDAYKIAAPKALVAKLSQAPSTESI